MQGDLPNMTCAKCACWRPTLLVAEEGGECWSTDSMGVDELTEPRRYTFPYRTCEAWMSADRSPSPTEGDGNG